MDGEKMLLVKEDSFLLDVLVKLANERLTQKQKRILSFLSGEQDSTATSLVKRLSKEMGCSRTALWNNLHSLKRAGLVDGGEGKAVKRSLVGKMLGGEHE